MKRAVLLGGKQTPRRCCVFLQGNIFTLTLSLFSSDVLLFLFLVVRLQRINWYPTESILVFFLTNIDVMGRRAGLFFHLLLYTEKMPATKFEQEQRKTRKTPSTGEQLLW